MLCTLRSIASSLLTSESIVGQIDRSFLANAGVSTASCCLTTSVVSAAYCNLVSELQAVKPNAEIVEINR